MTVIVLLALVLLLALLAPRYGADSRDLRDHGRETPHSTRRPGW